MKGRYCGSFPRMCGWKFNLSPWEGFFFCNILREIWVVFYIISNGKVEKISSISFIRDIALKGEDGQKGEKGIRSTNHPLIQSLDNYSLD